MIPTAICFIARNARQKEQLQQQFTSDSDYEIIVVTHEELSTVPQPQHDVVVNNVLQDGAETLMIEYQIDAIRQQFPNAKIFIMKFGGTQDEYAVLNVAGVWDPTHSPQMLYDLIQRVG